MSHKTFLGLPRIDIINLDERMDKFKQFCDEKGITLESAMGLPTEQLRALGFIDCHLPAALHAKTMCEVRPLVIIQDAGYSASEFRVGHKMPDLTRVESDTILNAHAELVLDRLAMSDLHHGGVQVLCRTSHPTAHPFRDGTRVVADEIQHFVEIAEATKANDELFIVVGDDNYREDLADYKDVAGNYWAAHLIEATKHLFCGSAIMTFQKFLHHDVMEEIHEDTMRRVIECLNINPLGISAWNAKVRQLSAEHTKQYGELAAADIEYNKVVTVHPPFMKADGNMMTKIELGVGIDGPALKGNPPAEAAPVSKEAAELIDSFVSKRFGSDTTLH